MNRRLALVALWAVFAVAAVGVGFAAAGLVEGPFTDSLSTQAGGDGAGATGGPSVLPTTPAPTGPPATSHSPTTRPPRGTSSGTDAPSTVTRSVSTRGGVVIARCTGHLVSVSASPAVGWRLDDYTQGRVAEAKVRFAASGGDGERVEVKATCEHGAPVFELEDERGSHDSDGGTSSDE